MFKLLTWILWILLLTTPVFAFAENESSSVVSGGESKYKTVIRTEDTQKPSAPTNESKYKLVIRNESTEKPAEDAKKLAENTEKPAKNTEKPAEDTKKPQQEAPSAVNTKHEERYLYTEPTVSITTFNRRLGDILFEIGSNTGYTISFGPQVDLNLTVVADLKNVPLSRAIDVLTRFVNYSYEIDHNEKAIKILKTITKTFSIPDIVINIPEMSSEMGGDMVGGGSGGSSSSGSSMFQGSGSDLGSQNLKANVTLKKTDDKIDGRKLFENNIKKLLSADGHYIIDWPSATLMVTDLVININLIEKYINKIKEVSGKQLVVYATITQVSTTKNYQYGIDWNVLAKRLGGEILTDSARGREMKLETNVTAISAPTFTITRTAADVTAVLKALEEQGNVKVIANPYLYVRNLQPVAIFSGKSVPYIGSIQRSVTGSIGESTTSFSISRAQDGVMLAVKCHINDNDTIDLQISPVLTSIDEFVTFNIEGNTFTNPISSVQQTMQNITIRDGETVVVGGVKQEKRDKSQKSVPVLSKIPILGALFKSENDTDTNSELVIAIKVKKIDQIAKSAEEN